MPKHIVVYVDRRGFCIAQLRPGNHGDDFYEIIAEAKSAGGAKTIIDALNEVDA